MNRNKILNTTKKLTLSFLVSCLFLTTAFALPDDAKQAGSLDAVSSQFFLDDGLEIHHGTTENPVEINQGSIKIIGLEVTRETVDDVLHKITINGDLAHFQQQPELDQAIIYGSGEIIVFNNTTQFLTIDYEAELIQDGRVLTGCHIEYDLNLRKVDVTPCEDGERLNMVIPPSPDTNAAQ